MCRPWSWGFIVEIDIMGETLVNHEWPVIFNKTAER